MKKYSMLFKNLKNKKKSKIPYSLNSKPQRYGPGVNRAVINVMKEVSASNTGRFALQTLLEGNTEFTSKRGLFKYFKILEIRATFLPANVVGAFSNIAAMFSWSLVQYNQDGLLKDDSTKFLPVYRTRSRTLRFLPPRTVLDVQTTGTTAPVKFFDFSQFLSTDLTVDFPGWLYVYNPSTSIVYFNFEAVILFRGNDTNPAPSTKIQEENPFIDRFFPNVILNLDKPPEHSSAIIEEDNEDEQEEKSAILNDSKEFKIDKIKELEKQIEELKMQLQEEKENQKEEEKEIQGDFVSKRNKPK